MKKIIKSLVVICMVALLSGCGNKTERLTCTMTKIDSTMTLNQELIAIFNNNEVTNMDMYMKVEVSESYIPYMDTFKTSFEEQFKSYSDNGVKVDITTEENFINVDMNYDFKNMTTEQKKNLNALDVYGTKEATKAALEKQGYTCK